MSASQDRFGPHLRAVPLLIVRMTITSRPTWSRSCPGRRASTHTAATVRASLLPAAILLGVAPCFGHAQATDREGNVPAGPPRLQQDRVVLDGRADEPVWRGAWTVPGFHQLTPDEGELPSESTAVRIFYDDQAMYVAVQARESDPSAIVDRYFERDAYHRSDQDGIGIILNTDGDPRTAYGFIVTPSGGRTDIAVRDPLGQPTWNTDWNAFWEAKSIRDEAGWRVEMRIPFSSLRFEPDANGDVRMGLIVWRYVARNSEFDVFPEIPNNWRNSAYKPSQASPIVFRGIEPRRPLYLKPYVLGGMSQRNLLAETGDSYTGVSSWTSELGGDLKYNVTSNLVMDLTVNTDFAQVEADDQIVNLERFSLFFPEKRDFFQERSDLFEFSVPGRMNESLFHSRTIGIVDGQPIPIHGGARLTGCYRDWDVGLLNMQTAAATVNGRTVAAENFGVLRLRRPVGDRGSYVGGMLTSRTDLRSAYNLVYALDADLHIVDDYFVDMKVAQSVEPDVDPLAGIMAAMFFQRRINRGFFVGTSYRYVGPDFNPAVGFMPRTGYNRVGNRIAYTWFPSTESSIQNHSLAHLVQVHWDHHLERLQTHAQNVAWNFDFRNSSSASARVSFTEDVVDQPFEVGSVGIPQGRYRFVGGVVSYASPSGRALQAGGELRGGGFYGGVTSWASRRTSPGILGRTSPWGRRASTTVSTCPPEITTC